METFFQMYGNLWMIGTGAVLVGLMMVVLFLWIKLRRTQRMIQQILPESEASFLEILDQQRAWNQEINQSIIKLHKKDRVLQELVDGAFQYRGIVTYRAFDIGGRELSFSLAVLDAKQNGWVLSSLYAGAEGSSVYLKAIEAGKPIERLTPEEEKALQQAIVKLS
jgi:hypothetical protein